MAYIDYKDVPADVLKNYGIDAPKENAQEQTQNVQNPALNVPKLQETAQLVQGVSVSQETINNLVPDYNYAFGYKYSGCFC